MKVALVYDRVNKWGGAERVLLALHELFPKAPLYTSVYNPQKAPWARVFKVRTSFLQRFPFAKSRHELYAILMPLVFERFSFDSYDLVISVTSESAKGIITIPTTKHICYCLTPTRYLWSGYREYFKNPFFRFISYPFVMYLRKWDKVASQRPDMIISIGNEVKRRVKKYYQRESQVIYPALAESTFSSHVKKKESSQKTTVEDKDFFLVVSRLVRYKRIDLAIKACNKLKLPLVVVGTGSEKQKLLSMADETVSFVGYLTEEELLQYYKRSQALIFPGKEDFGLAILEAQKLGKPVIAFKGGGALETVVEGKTGIFFEKQSVLSVVEALEKFKRKRFDPALCKKNAKAFSYLKFATSWQKILDENLMQETNNHS